MKLNKKKELAARTLGIGKERIVFNNQRLDEIKEAITKQDIKDLVADKAILIKEVKGRRTHVKRKTRRRVGSKRIIPGNKKRKYVLLTRKLRTYLFHLKKKNEISKDLFLELRKEIRAHNFKSLGQMKEKILEVKK